MEKTYLDRLFSAGRLTRFYAVAQQDATEAAALYAGNIQLSESLYPVLTVAEVGLRNAIHRQLSHFFQTADWYRQIGQTPGLAGLQLALAKAEDHIKARREIVTADKVVAELNFGFWATLFNRAHEDVLWKQLRIAFPHLPKPERQRATVAAAVNATRVLRNRVYHNEPICWRLDDLRHQHAQVCQLVGWIAPQLLLWLEPLDRFAAVLASEVARRAARKLP